MTKTYQGKIIITLLTLGAMLLAVSTLSSAYKYAHETECFKMTKDIRCYEPNRWEKSRN